MRSDTFGVLMPVANDLDVDAIAFEMRELIDLVIADKANWQDVVELLGARVPGTFAALISQGSRRRLLNQMWTHNLDRYCQVV
jgi:hypothetical protein